MCRRVAYSKISLVHGGVLPLNITGVLGIGDGDVAFCGCDVAAVASGTGDVVGAGIGVVVDGIGDVVMAGGMYLLITLISWARQFTICTTVILTFPDVAVHK